MQLVKSMWKTAKMKEYYELYLKWYNLAATEIDKNGYTKKSEMLDARGLYYYRLAHEERKKGNRN